MTVRNGTVALSWGPWGGIYAIRGRLCLGWIAITYVHVEIDDLMEGYAAWFGKPSDDLVERGAEALCRFLFPGRIVPRLEMARAVLAAVTDRRSDWRERLPAKRVFADDPEWAVEALQEIHDDLGAGRIRWEPNYPEVQHALQVAEMAIAKVGRR